MKLLKNPHKLWPQVLGALCASIGYLTMGVVRGWTSPGLPSLFESGKVPGLDRQVDEPWIASCPQLSAIAGSLIVAWPLQKYGRKWTMLVMVIPWILSLLLIGFAQNRAMIYAGRVCGGLMEGTITPAAQIFIAEISSPRVRGVLGSTTGVSLAMGILISYVIGAYVPWDLLSFILIIFPAIFAASFAFLPESPIWLLTQQRGPEAREALQFYRGKCTEVDEEFKRMQENVENMSQQQNIRIRDLFRGPVMKPLAISVALMFFQQFSGLVAVVVYTVKIFEMAGSTIDKNTATVIIGAVLVAGLSVAAYMVDVYGRRTLLLVSGVSMTVPLFSMGTFFYMKELWGDKQAEESLGWLPLASLVLFVVAFSAGYGNIPFIIMGELFPVRYRHILSPISSCVFVLTTFIIVVTFPFLVACINLYGTFWFYACWCVVSVVFVYFFLPETKGKTLEEIEDLFNPDAARRTEFNSLSQQTNRRRSSAQPALASPRRGSMILVATTAAAAAAAAMSTNETVSV